LSRKPSEAEIYRLGKSCEADFCKTQMSRKPSEARFTGSAKAAKQTFAKTQLSVRAIGTLFVAAVLAVGCPSPRSPAPASTTGTPPTSSARPPPPYVDEHDEHDLATLDEAPRLGFLERRVDGTCWYGTSASGPLQRVLRCPPTTVDASQKGPPTEDAQSGGWLEKVVENGTCWWSLHAPDDCPIGAVCKPDPPVTRVRCP
jgi:hypothetical protein